MNELQKEVEQRRLFRRIGVGTGVAFLSGGLGVGVVAGVLDGNVVGGAFSTVGIVGSALLGPYTFSFEKRSAWDRVPALCVPRHAIETAAVQDHRNGNNFCNFSAKAIGKAALPSR
jgi:hypothetical protein